MPRFFLSTFVIFTAGESRPPNIKGNWTKSIDDGLVDLFYLSVRICLSFTHKHRVFSTGKCNCYVSRLITIRYALSYSIFTRWTVKKRRYVFLLLSVAILQVRNVWRSVINDFVLIGWFECILKVNKDIHTCEGMRVILSHIE